MPIRHLMLFTLMASDSLGRIQSTTSDLSRVMAALRDYQCIQEIVIPAERIAGNEVGAKMIERKLSIAEIILIAGTRVALGVGIGLLLSSRLSNDQRKAAGLALSLVG